MKKIIFLFNLVLLALAGSAAATPGLIQTATRAGHWANDYPDVFLFAQNLYYYSTDEFNDKQGHGIDIPDTKVSLGISRFVMPYHFGENNQFQHIIEAILLIQSTSFDTGDGSSSSTTSGFGDPLIYESIGWNNLNKTTHLTLGYIAQLPFGDEDLREVRMKNGEFGSYNDSYKLMPVLAWQQRMGHLWMDTSLAYMHCFDDLDDNDSHGRDYLEWNLMFSYRFGKLCVHVQGDYTNTRESKYYGVKQDDDGYNIAAAFGIAWFIKPTVELSLKYVSDVDGENEAQGSGINFRMICFFF